MLDQMQAIFTSYPSFEPTVASNSREVSTTIGLGPGSLGAGTTGQSATEGHTLAAGLRPIFTFVKPGWYDDVEMPRGVRNHKQMHLKVGVFTALDEHNNGRVQVLDEERISGNRILVLRPGRLSPPYQFKELHWPVEPIDIMNQKK